MIIGVSPVYLMGLVITTWLVARSSAKDYDDGKIERHDRYYSAFVGVLWPAVACAYLIFLILAEPVIWLSRSRRRCRARVHELERRVAELERQPSATETKEADRA